MPSQKGLLAGPRLPRKVVLVCTIGRRTMEPGHRVHKTKEFILQPGNKNLCITQISANSLNTCCAVYGPTLYTVANSPWEGNHGNTDPQWRQNWTGRNESFGFQLLQTGAAVHQWGRPEALYRALK